jgi:hypothetical protein
MSASAIDRKAPLRRTWVECGHRRHVSERRFRRATADGVDSTTLLDVAVEELNQWLDLRTLGEGECVFDVHPEIANGTFNFSVA